MTWHFAVLLGHVQAGAVLQVRFGGTSSGAAELLAGPGLTKNPDSPLTQRLGDHVKLLVGPALVGVA